MIHLIVTFEASGEKLAAFRQILQQVKTDLPQVPHVVQSGGWEHIRAHLLSDPLSSYLREV